jgi:threonyl-tRNA synthetase
VRFLAWHVDYFKCHITERGRSPLVEEYDDPETVAENALLVLASVEKGDEAAPETVSERTASEIATHAANLKVRTVVLHPFAHLFGQLSRPATAVRVLQMVEERLRARGLAVIRTPFGWFNALEIRAKGHPLSRVARTVSAKGTGP